MSGLLEGALLGIAVWQAIQMVLSMFLLGTRTTIDATTVVTYLVLGLLFLVGFLVVNGGL